MVLNYHLIVLLFSGLFLGLLVNCQQESVDNAFPQANHPDTIEINPSMHHGLELTSLVDQMRLVPLESIEESMIGRIDKLMLSDSLIVILDQMYSRAVFAFDWNGRFLYKISQVGDGPGEFVDIFDIDINGDHLYLLDSGWKIIRYDKYTGKVDKEYPFKNWVGMNFVIDYSGNRAVTCRNFGHDDAIEAQVGKCLIFSTELIDEDYQCLFPYADHFKGETSGPNVLFSRNNEDILIAPSYTYQLYRYQNGSPDPFLYFDFGDRSFDADELKAVYRSSPSASQFLKSNSYIHHLFSCAFTDQYLFATYIMGNTTFNFVIDLSSNKVVMGGNPFFFSEEYGFTLHMPRATHKDWFVSILDHYFVLNNYMENEPFLDLLQAHHITDVDENDNPILAFFTVDEAKPIKKL